MPDIGAYTAASAYRTGYVRLDRKGELATRGTTFAGRALARVTSDKAGNRAVKNDFIAALKARYGTGALDYLEGGHRNALKSEGRLGLALVRDVRAALDRHEENSRAVLAVLLPMDDRLEEAARRQADPRGGDDTGKEKPGWRGYDAASVSQRIVALSQTPQGRIHLARAAAMAGNGNDAQSVWNFLRGGMATASDGRGYEGFLGRVPAGEAGAAPKGAARDVSPRARAGVDAGRQQEANRSGPASVPATVTESAGPRVRNRGDAYTQFHFEVIGETLKEIGTPQHASNYYLRRKAFGYMAEEAKEDDWAEISRYANSPEIRDDLFGRIAQGILSNRRQEIESELQNDIAALVAKGRENDYADIKVRVETGAKAIVDNASLMGSESLSSNSFFKNDGTPNPRSNASRRVRTEVREAVRARSQELVARRVAAEAAPALAAALRYLDAAGDEVGKEAVLSRLAAIAQDSRGQKRLRELAQARKPN